MTRALTVLTAVLLFLGVSAAWGSSDDVQFQSIASQQAVKADIAASISAYSIPDGLTWDGRYLKVYNADSHLLTYQYDFVNFTNGPIYLAASLPDGSGVQVHQGDHVEVEDGAVGGCEAGTTDYLDGTCAPQDLTDTDDTYPSLQWAMLEGGHYDIGGS